MYFLHMVVVWQLPTCPFLISLSDVSQVCFDIRRRSLVVRRIFFSAIVRNCPREIYHGRLIARLSKEVAVPFARYAKTVASSRDKLI